MVRIMASNAAASAEDSTRRSTDQARLGSSAASGLPKAITPVRTPTARTNERRSALCSGSICVARGFTFSSALGPDESKMDEMIAAAALRQRRHHVTQATARICQRELL